MTVHHAASLLIARCLLTLHRVHAACFPVHSPPPRSFSVDSTLPVDSTQSPCSSCIWRITIGRRTTKTEACDWLRWTGFAHRKPAVKDAYRLKNIFLEDWRGLGKIFYKGRDGYFILIWDLLSNYFWWTLECHLTVSQLILVDFVGLRVDCAI